MLDPWIIEQIRRREEEERRQRDELNRPVLELPIPDSPRWRRSEREEDRDRQDNGDPDYDEYGNRREREEAPKRGVVIIGM